MLVYLSMYMYVIFKTNVQIVTGMLIEQWRCNRKQPLIVRI